MGTGSYATLVGILLSPFFTPMVTSLNSSGTNGSAFFAFLSGVFSPF
jgi:hypothetical protein